MKNEREQTTIRLPSELKEQLQKQAEDMGFTFNAFLLMLLDEWANRQE